MPTIQGMSLVPIFLELLLEDLRLATASAFIHRKNKKTFLVTARHNLTAQHPETGQNLHSSGARPDRLRAWLPKENIGEWIDRIWPLKWNEDRLWYGHAIKEDLIDVAVLPIEEDSETQIRTALSKETAPDLALHVGAEVFVLGYPAGLTASKRFPIWKRGTIASEPELDVDDLPKLLIDTATYSGMSGSAVYAASTGGYVSEKGHRVFTAGAGVLHSRFVGVYSSRLNAKEEASNQQINLATQIGVVWKRSVIDEIIDGI